MDAFLRYEHFRPPAKQQKFGKVFGWLNSDRLKHQICNEEYNLPQIITWNKHKCLIFITFSTSFLFDWGLTDTPLITLSYLIFISLCSTPNISITVVDVNVHSFAFFFFIFSGNSVKICVKFGWKPSDQHLDILPLYRLPPVF